MNETAEKRRYTQNALFRGGPETWLNACVGLNGGPKEFDEYADGFFQGGFAIVRAAEAREAPVDVLIYPAVFAFRHGIELYVKHLLTRFQTLNSSADGYAPTHKLTDNWALLVAAVKEAGMGELPADKVRMAESFIKDFCEVDPRGDAFRYPEDRLGKPTLSDVSLVNILVLRDGMLLLHGSSPTGPTTWRRCSGAPGKLRIDGAKAGCRQNTLSQRKRAACKRACPGRRRGAGRGKGEGERRRHGQSD